MLGTIIKIASAGAAVLGANYAAFKAIPIVGKVVGSKWWEVTKSSVLLQEPFLELCGIKLDEEFFESGEELLCSIVQVTLKTLWCVGQVLAAKVAFYDHCDTTMKLLGLSAETNTSHENNEQEAAP